MKYAQIPKYQNTYRLESFEKFNPQEADKIVHNLLEGSLRSVTSYEPGKMAKLCMEIASEVQKALCRKDYDR